MVPQRKIEDYFKKSFEFTGNKHWFLPKETYKTPPWHIASLQDMKLELNNVKSQLSNFNLEKWSKHTKLRDPSSSIISTLKTKANIELLTQAWCKFYECLNRYPIVPEIAICKQELTSLHLCEAPGAFISALNRFLYTHYRKLEWTWMANTLNPYYEGNPASDMIADDRLIRHTIDNWNFGADLTGDLTKYYNHEAVVQEGPVMLVTADGSVDCMKDPGEQENNVHLLHYCETMTALRVLETWGSFVLKLFTVFEHGTICLVYLLTCCFTKVHVFKPCSSKSGNSEVYVICLGYKGWDIIEPLWPSLIGPYQGRFENTAMFALSEISPEFLKQLEQCAQFFMELQSATINDNVRHFTGAAQSNDEEISQLKLSVSEGFMKKFRLAYHIPKRYKLMGYERRQRFSESDWDFKIISLDNIPQLDFLDIRIGKALEEVTASCFCQAKFSSAPSVVVNDDKLEAAVYPFLGSNYKKIHHLQFCGIPQYKYQREFFYMVTCAVESESDIVIAAVPFLTRFLVGLVYVLAQGFKTVLVYKKGIFLFRDAVKEKLNLVKEYFKHIEAAYCQADYEEKFLADVLEIVPHNVLESGSFYEIICRYNNGIFEQK